MNAKQMIRTALAGAAMAVIAASSQAGVIGAADLVINSFGILNTATMTAVAPGTFSIQSDSRTGSANSDYNSVGGTGIGASSITNGSGNAVDVGYRCAGPDCGSISALYGTVENNTTVHLGAPATKNFSLGDMFIAGSALSNSATGFTRADAMAVGATNTGGSSATIQNNASVDTTFVSGNSFTAVLAVNATAFTRAFVDSATAASSKTFASGSLNFSVSIYDETANAFLLSFQPAELNGFTGVFAAKPSQSKEYNYNGVLFSSAVNIIAGHTYNLVVSQSSLASVSEIPEPASLALVGISLLGLAGVVARRRRQAK